MNLTRFEEFISQRKKVLSFKPDVPQDELLVRLVSVAQKSPSMLGLQPTRFVITKTTQIKEEILFASWAHGEMSTAPVFIVFTADRNVAIPEGGEKESFELLFSCKPLGFGWLFKALCVPFLRFFSPTPELPAVHKKAWLYKEVSLSAMHFMIAAETAGLSCAVLDFFDEGRVKKALKLPSSYVVPLIFAVGYPQEVVAEGTLLPVSDVIIRI